VILLYNILCAVCYLHSANVIHRDLKAHNILINDECRVKLCDFGLARSLPGKAGRVEDSFLVSSGETCLGEKPVKRTRNFSPHVQTRWYRSPEVILYQRE